MLAFVRMAYNNAPACSRFCRFPRGLSKHRTLSSQVLCEKCKMRPQASPFDHFIERFMSPPALIVAVRSIGDPVIPRLNSKLQCSVVMGCVTSTNMALPHAMRMHVSPCSSKGKGLRQIAMCTESSAANGSTTIWTRKTLTHFLRYLTCCDKHYRFLQAQMHYTIYIYEVSMQYWYASRYWRLNFCR